jgi:hypothetical protein
MLDTVNRAERYRDLAQECRHLATTTLSSQMKNRYSLMARDYILLADVEDQAHAFTRRRLERMPRTREPVL